MRKNLTVFTIDYCDLGELINHKVYGAISLDELDKEVYFNLVKKCYYNRSELYISLCYSYGDLSQINFTKPNQYKAYVEELIIPKLLAEGIPVMDINDALPSCEDDMPF